MKIVEMLQRDFGLTPVIATEIEFYLHDAPAQPLDVIRQRCADAGIMLASCEAERGPNQYEIALEPQRDCARIAADTERFKALMTDADFSAKPLPDAPGSGLHVHLHLEDASGKNVFFREDDFSPQLLHAIGGLLAFMNPCMPVFAPTEASYARFAAKSNAPTTVSWGTNNRTVAIRLPSKPLDNKHLEHRVAGADADAGQVIAAILAGVHYGLVHQCNPGEPIYGDASLVQYALLKLALSPREALAYRRECLALRKYLELVEA